jgi:isoaspartyl peptidase/L-asparaginase-like protein (Ntn-hydrolase superfamily)
MPREDARRDRGVTVRIAARILPGVSSIVIAVHGGAGGWAPAREDRDRSAALRRGLAEALRAGRDAMRAGGSALDGVTAAVVVLEDCAVMNAGRGSVLRSDGTAVMDASLMDGRDRRAGAVAAVRGIRNPVRAARWVMESSPHVLLVGEAAETFATACGIERAPLDYFVTPEREAQLARVRRGEAARSDRAEERADATDTPDTAGTVGAVARDAAGHVAAATSTGGTTNAAAARVGDSPIVGAGIWADDATCAVSGTGQGEHFIRAAFAHEVDALMRLAGMDVESACERALERVSRGGGSGGCAAVDAGGRVALPFTTPAMPRGVLAGKEEPRVAILAGGLRTGSRTSGAHPWNSASSSPRRRSAMIRSRFATSLRRPKSSASRTS